MNTVIESENIEFFELSVHRRNEFCHLAKDLNEHRLNQRKVYLFRRIQDEVNIKRHKLPLIPILLTFSGK